MQREVYPWSMKPTRGYRSVALEPIIGMVVWYYKIYQRHGRELPYLCESLNTKERTLFSKWPTWLPWQKIGTDLFFLNGANYFSQNIEAIKLKTTTPPLLRDLSPRHGIPETVISDNGPQYFSHKFADFASSYSFHHITSSPHYPQSNGQAECTV